MVRSVDCMNGSDVPVLSGALAYSLRSASQGGWAEVLLTVHHLDMIMSYVQSARPMTRSGFRPYIFHFRNISVSGKSEHLK